jgi:hypothetical protein
VVKHTVEAHGGTVSVKSLAGSRLAARLMTSVSQGILETMGPVFQLQSK